MASVLILAGGSGERFWPVSTKLTPKQFLPLTGGLPIILETVDRVKDLVGLQKTYVVTTKAHYSLVRRVVSELPAENIIVEPEGRNTAPSVILSIAYIKLKEGKNEIIAVLPSDHFVADTKKFKECLEKAFTITDTRNKIVTFGMKPDRPETDYGYISVNDEVEPDVLEGVQFREKPDYNTACNYLNSGRYLWNSGIFIFRIDTIVKLLKKYAPELYRSYLELEQAQDSPEIKKIYSKLPRVSIDYALMEKLSSFLVIPAAYGWDDLGTWRSLETIYPKDHNGNIFCGKGVLTDVTNCVIYSRDMTMAAIGIENLVIAVSKDGILICPKELIKDVKGAVEKINAFQAENLKNGEDNDGGVTKW